MSAPKRIQRQRTRGWRMPAGAVYVGRPTVWGNPFVVHTPEIVLMVGDTGQSWWCPDGRAAETAVELYRAWAPEHLALDCLARHLAGLDLACWCRLSSPCHADVLLELANREA